VGILSRPRFLPQQRLDLEDVNALLSALRTDSKLYTKQFLSSSNLIYKGFSVTGVGLKAATVVMANATLIFPQNTNDFSYFVASPTESNLTISDADLTDGVRNYVELSLSTENNTSLTKAFWDPEANSGDGSEFNQIVETITDLKVDTVVSTSGFSNSNDRLPLCIIDVDGSGNIKTILDRRNMFGRLGVPTNIDSQFSWGTRQEPTYAMTLTGVTGTFVAGETLTINTETATCITGGTTSITFNVPSGINFFPGSTVTGGTSGATGTVGTITESFTGADKNLGSQKEINDALMTEIALMKGTRFWHLLQENSLTGVSTQMNSLIIGLTSGARWSWSGSALSITDDAGSPASTDNIGRIKLFGRSQAINLRRADGTASTSAISIADGSVLYITLPATGDRNYSAAGSGSTNYKTAASSSFTISDTNYWLAYREGSKLYVRGYGELMTGESAEISDPVTQQILTYIGASNEADYDPNYSSVTVVSQGGSLTSAIGQLDANAAVLAASVTTEQTKENQDRTTKLVRGGTWSWNSTTGVLTWDADAFLQLGGLAEAVNKIAAGNITLDADGKVAWVTTKRTAGSSTLTVTATAIASVTMNDNIRIFARRLGTSVLIGESFLLKDGEYLELDGALAEINRQLGTLKLKASSSSVSKVVIANADMSLLDGQTLSQELSTYLLNFDGAVINFTTGAIKKADDSTALGTDFTPQVIPSGEYFWYGVALSFNSVDSGNRGTATVTITPAASSNSVLASAPYPNIVGDKKIGAVLVKNISGTITVQSVVRLGTGAGGSGSSTNVKARLYDKTLTTVPTGTSATIDGVTVVNNDLVLFANLASNNNKIYKVTGVGTALVWTAQRSFSSSTSPTDGDTVRIQEGTAFADQNAVFDGTNWKINESRRLYDATTPANYMEETYVHSIALLASQTGTAISALTFSATTYSSIEITIQVKEATTNLILFKQILVTYDGTNIGFSSVGSTTGPSITFDADVSGGNIRLLYTSSTNTATARAWVKKFLA
jgi:hypothetical protein